MATFVLVHGSSCGAWVWQKLSPLLRAAGHGVWEPTLSGLGDRSHLLPCGINLSTHIGDVANLLFHQDLSNVILVGNSYGGMVITGVAAKAHERLKLLVYLDAYVPEDGKCEFDLLPPAIGAARQADAEAHGGAIPPPPLTLFGVTDPDLLHWAQMRMTPQPLHTYTEPVPIGNVASRALPRVFIHCTGNPATTPDLFASSVARAMASGWPVYDLPAGHLAMLTAPGKLAQLILEITSAQG